MLKKKYMLPMGHTLKKFEIHQLIVQLSFIWSTRLTWPLHKALNLSLTTPKVSQANEVRSMPSFFATALLSDITLFYLEWPFICLQGLPVTHLSVFNITYSTKPFYPSAAVNNPHTHFVPL